MSIRLPAPPPFLKPRDDGLGYAHPLGQVPLPEPRGFAKVVDQLTERQVTLDHGTHLVRYIRAHLLDVIPARVFGQCRSPTCLGLCRLLLRPTPRVGFGEKNTTESAVVMRGQLGRLVPARVAA